jgi:hypothetical protein
MFMRWMSGPLGLLAVLGVAGAAPAPRAEPPGQAATTLRLPINQDVEVENRGTRLRLRLTEVSDSRCPSDVICIRAGEAKASVRVTPLAPGQAGNATTVALSLPGEPQAALGRTFRLDALEPYPLASRQGPVAYVATVTVSPGRGN